MFYDSGFMGGMHGLWWLFWLVLIGALLFFVWNRGDRGSAGPGETAKELLQRRLARGEITPAQYEERKALLDRDAAR